MVKLFTGITAGIILLLVVGLVVVDRMESGQNPQQYGTSPQTSAQTTSLSPTPVGQGGSVDAKILQVQGGDKTVTIDKNGAHPNVTVISHGAKVIWSNTTDKPVKIVSAPIGSNPDFPALNLGIIDPGQSKSLLFDKEGSFGYKVGSSVTGAVIAL